MGVEMLMLAGTALSAGGSISQGADAAEAGYTQQALDEIDAKANIETAQYNAEKQRRRGQQAKATARAAYAASGVKVDTGTAADVVEDIGERAEEDVYQILLEGGQMSNRMRSRGTAAAKAGKDMQNASLINAGATALGGFGDMKKAGWV